MKLDVLRGSFAHGVHPEEHKEQTHHVPIARMPFVAERNWIASRIGVTFKRSVEMSGDIYKAMLSRGFQGEYRSVTRSSARAVDAVWLVAVVSLGGILVLFERGLLW